MTDADVIVVGAGAGRVSGHRGAGRLRDRHPRWSPRRCSGCPASSAPARP